MKQLGEYRVLTVHGYELTCLLYRQIFNLICVCIKCCVTRVSGCDIQQCNVTFLCQCDMIQTNPICHLFKTQVFATISKYQIFIEILLLRLDA